MKRFLLATHGLMAGGIKSSVDILLGGSEGLSIINAYVDESDFETSVKEFFDTVPEDDQVIMLSDIYGGSVNQVMFRYLNRPSTFLLSGVNLPLVLELLVDGESDFTEEELSQKVADASMAIRLVKDEAASDTEENFF